MKIFADTSFFIAALIESHPHHSRTMPWIEKLSHKKIDLGVSSHSIAEIFAILTTLPIVPRIPPGTALEIINNNIIQNSHVIELKTSDYLKCLHLATERGLHGGIIYDILIAYCFDKFKGDGILTFNHKDFARILPDKKEFIIVP
ncbi:MAG TPA: PIN domain-containing protein [Candidatus Ozemobacteraceae bacterium]|nr:PIN domain-containing protein [Candidatus Ozemobacteraceae bacterium]